MRRQFRVDVTGIVDGDLLTLDERFVYNDGETDRRIWRIRDKTNGEFEGEAADVIGKATGTAAGNALNWTYEMNLKVGGGTWRVTFDDWMFLQEDGVLINRAPASKNGAWKSARSRFLQETLILPRIRRIKPPITGNQA